MTANDIDKWALYQVAKYCDELVPDGFGGQEPRFVCNAYITDLRQAADLLNDLASVFCGLAVWNGNQISVLQDKHSDPVAHYGNGNVKDGKFDYASAQMKAIHTAVHVKYSDKHDGYRAKVEYIANNQAISCYGLNVKQVTAFGCDSRGQAARFGAWILQTELKQQHTITFTVGREGLKHLPYDIIRIADNHYAGAEISGRIVAVSGNQITLDREIKNAVGAMWFYTDTVSGSLKSVKIAQQINKTQIRLESQINVQMGAFWAMSGRVKPRLYRAMSVKENTNDGTYTITALLHDAEKYSVIDESAVFDNAVNTLHGSIPELHNAAVSAENGGLRLSWDNLTADGDVLDYDIKLYKNNVLYRHIPNNPTAEIRFDNLPNGDYRAEIRGRNARGVYSKPLIKAWQINYEIKGLRANPKTLAIELVWTLPEILTTAAHTEIWYAKENNFQAAQKLSKLPAPQNSYTLTGVGVLETYYFWARLVDENGNSGEFTAVVVGKSDPNPAPIVAHIQGAITKTELSQALLNQFKADDLAAENRAKAAAAADAANKVAAEATARAAAIRAEANARADSIRAETTARTAAIQNAADNQAAALRAEAQKLNTAIANAAQTAQSNLNTKAAELTQKASELGNRITQVETVNTQQAQAIQTVTAAQSNTAAALEAEKIARANGDRAESQARETLAAKVQQNTVAIASEREARTTAQTAETRAREALAARVGNAETAINAERTARTTADQAQTAEINAAKSRIGTAEGSLNNLQRTMSEQNRALSESLSTLSAKTTVGENLVSDGLLQNAAMWRSYYNHDLNKYFVSDLTDGKFGSVGVRKRGATTFWNYSRTDTVILPERTYRFSAWVRKSAHYSGFNYFVYERKNLNNYGHFRFDDSRLRANEWVYIEQVARGSAFGDTLINVGFALAHTNAASDIVIEMQNFRFEDITDSVQTDNIQAELTAHKSAQAETDRAQTAEINTAKSQIGNNKSAIDSIRTTKADKAEVASLARTTLQSEWRSDVNAAKTQSATDAQAKADAAKQAAIIAADTAATAKANAAKSAAIAEATNTATAKAEAAKAAAIADAAAKDAVLKQQAATDAQTKADAAKNAAIAEATRLNTATTAKITALEQTVSNQNSATASQISELKTSFGKAAGANQLPNPNLENWQSNMPVGWVIYNNNRSTQPETVTHLAGQGVDKSTAIRVAWSGRNGSTKGIYTNIALWEKGEFYILAVAARVPDGQPENGKIALHFANAPAWLNQEYLAQPILSRNWQWTVLKAKKPAQDTGRYNEFFISVESDYTGEAVEYCLPYASKGEVWTGYKAPDFAGNLATLEAALTSEREARTTADRAQTAEIQAAKSQIGNNKSAIDSIRTTKADKTEVASLARTTLQSEWRSDVNAAKTQSATDAQAKAEAAKQAAITAADTAATAKASAAKSAAIAEAANTATAKAEAAKAAAIADAAAKDAVLKQQAATDAQTKADAAKNAAIAEATRLNTATTAKITALEQTVSNQNSATASQISELKTSFGKAAGANQLPNPNLETWANGFPVGWYGYNNNRNPQPETVTRLAGQGVDKSTAIRVAWSGQNGSTKGIYTHAALWEKGEFYILAIAARVPDGQPENGKIGLHFANLPAWIGQEYLAQPTLSRNWQWTVLKAKKPVQDTGAFNQLYISVIDYTGEAVEYCLPYASKGEVWTGYKAPDFAENLATLEAALTSEREARTTADRAQTAEIQAAKSQMNQNKSAIDSIRTTKADKTEVASLARTTLQSEWRSDVNAAKNQAATDAQTKADAAKQAAITAADTAATAKANAAKSAAIAEAANTATAKAEAAKAAAIADAAAKDAVLKQQAATDAQTKADTAKNAAIAEATRLNTATTAKITVLEQTVSNQNSATATQISGLTAKLDNLQVGGRNYLKNSNFSNDLRHWSNWGVAERILISGSLKLAANNNEPFRGIGQVIDNLEPNTQYTLSFMAWAAVGEVVNFGVHFRKPSGILSQTWGNIQVGSEMARYSTVITTPNVAEFNQIYLMIGGVARAPYEIYLNKIKFERGNVATDWSPAPEDVEGQATAIQAELTAHKSAQAETDRAQTAEINTAKSQIGTAQSEISSLKTTVANNQQTATTQINSLNSKMGTAEANIRTAQTATTALNGKVQSLYTLKTETVSGGKKVVAGLSVGADGASGESQFNIHANKFAVWDGGSLKPVFSVVTQNGKTMTAISGDLIADGTILGKHLAASQMINAPTISGGVISGSLIRGARMEAVDLEAANIIGDVVAARTFAVEENRLICRIGTSRKTSRTLVVPQILAVAENGETVVLSLWLNGVKQSEKTLTSPTKTVGVKKRVEHTFHTPALQLNAQIAPVSVSGWIPPTQVSGHIPGTRVSGWVNGGTVSGDIPGTNVSATIPGTTVSGQINGTNIGGTIPQQAVLLNFEIPIDIPYTTPKTGGIAYSKVINGSAHTLEILCTIDNNRDLRPLGDVSGVVCFVI
nr:phage tail protein [Alysiella crassa]UOP05862.1 phage tail protein [Alysiella crassa]